MTSFNQFADSIDIKFQCPHCGKAISYHIDDIPSPDWSGETAESSSNYDEIDFQCPYCEHDYSAELFVNIYEGDVMIVDYDERKEVEAIEVGENYIDEEEYEKELEGVSIAA